MTASMRAEAPDSSGIADSNAETDIKVDLSTTFVSDD